jgi:pyridinium-3,5-biscarboxylic acid mononucleotide synthase
VTSSPPPELRLDWLRQARTGLPEAILTAGKTPAQLRAIVAQAAQEQRSLLFTRVSFDDFTILESSAVKPQHVDDCRTSKTTMLWWGPPRAPEQDRGVVVVSAGSSDVPVAKEAVRTLHFDNCKCIELYDVGVAGLWRLLQHAETIQQASVVLCVAGMDAALPSVVGGIARGVVIAVPTSTGYGVAHGGETALHSALCACSSGVVVANIDNGYGAACAALRATRIR